MKTDEAKRLQEDIAEIYRERSVMDLTKSAEIINKVLDAAVEELDKAGIPIGQKIYARAAINKLRP